MAFSMSRFVAAMILTSVLIVCVPPTRSNSLSSTTRSSLACMARLTLADLVEEDRAAVGQLEAPELAAVGAGERALLVAEQLRLRQRLRQRRAVELDERPVPARRDVVDDARDESLAGARLAAQQHGRVPGWTPCGSRTGSWPRPRSCRRPSRDASRPAPRAAATRSPATAAPALPPAPRTAARSRWRSRPDRRRPRGTSGPSARRDAAPAR